MVVVVIYLFVTSKLSEQESVDTSNEYTNTSMINIFTHMVSVLFRRLGVTWYFDFKTNDDINNIFFLILFYDRCFI